MSFELIAIVAKELQQLPKKDLSLSEASKETFWPELSSSSFFCPGASKNKKKEMNKGTRRAAVVVHRLERWRGQFENWKVVALNPDGF